MCVCVCVCVCVEVESFWCQDKENSGWDISLFQPRRTDSHHGTLRCARDICTFTHISRVYVIIYYCPGCGKTTFLDVLTGRRKTGNTLVSCDEVKSHVFDPVT